MLQKAVLLLLFSAMLSLAGAEEDEPPLLMLEEREPAAGSRVTVITREQIERSQMPFVLDLLRTVPGLTIIQAGTPGKTALVLARGSQPEQVLIVIDGARFNGGLLPVDLAHLATTNVERIVVERGPQSAGMGSSAVGAVVHIFTRYSGPVISARAEYGSNSTQRYGIRSGAGSDANHYAIAYDGYDSDGEGNQNDYRNNTLSARAKVMITQWTSAAFVYRDTDTSGGAVSIRRPARDETRTRLLSVPLQQQIGEWFSVEARFSDLRQEVNDQRSRTRTFLLAGHVRPTPAHDIVAGYERENQKTTLFEFSDEQEITGDAVFVEYRWNPGTSFQTAIGLRMDDDSVNASRVSPRISASYKLQDRIRIHGSAGSGYRRPAPEEVRFITTNRESAEGFDLGIEFVEADRITADATFFHTRYNDTILNLPFFGPRNLPPYSASGMELEAAFRPLPGLQIRGNYTYTNSEDLSLAPNHSGFLGFQYERSRLTCAWDWYIVGESTAGESRNRADAAVSYRLWKGLQIYTRATNLFDSKYSEITGFRAEGRAGYFGLRWN